MKTVQTVQITAAIREMEMAKVKENKMEKVIEMDKKILSIFFLLMIVISATVLFVTLNQSSSQENQQNDFSAEDLTDEDISSEIDDEFLSEDDEIDIGEMV